MRGRHVVPGRCRRTERHHDPLELWVGTWTPEEWVEREARRAEERKKQDEGSSGMSPRADESPSLEE